MWSRRNLRCSDVKEKIGFDSESNLLGLEVIAEDILEQVEEIDIVTDTSENFMIQGK